MRINTQYEKYTHISYLYIMYMPNIAKSEAMYRYVTCMYIPTCMYVYMQAHGHVLSCKYLLRAWVAEIHKKVVEGTWACLGHYFFIRSVRGFRVLAASELFGGLRVGNVAVKVSGSSEG